MAGQTRLPLAPAPPCGYGVPGAIFNRIVSSKSRRPVLREHQSKRRPNPQASSRKMLASAKATYRAAMPLTRSCPAGSGWRACWRASPPWQAHLRTSANARQRCKQQTRAAAGSASQPLQAALERARTSVGLHEALLACTHDERCVVVSRMHIFGRRSRCTHRGRRSHRRRRSGRCSLRRARRSWRA